MKKWDVFISHASEDKAEVAVPLARVLERCGLSVWLDRFELKVGDSLREKIDEGLAESTFGIVVLSDFFLKKPWPKRELNGLFALEEEGMGVILPVWHRVDKKRVSSYSPMLADRLAADTSSGIFAVAESIASVVLRATGKRSGKATLAGQFLAALEMTPVDESVISFLTMYPKVLLGALGHRGLDEMLLRIRPRFQMVQVDLALGHQITTVGGFAWDHLFFGPTTEFHDPSRPPERLRAMLKWLNKHPEDAADQLFARTKRPPHGEQHHSGILVVGRRANVSPTTIAAVNRDLNELLKIRSYDWLIEACILADRKRY